MPTHPFNRTNQDSYTQSINPPTDVAMTIKELLIQEIDSAPDELMANWQLAVNGQQVFKINPLQ